MSDINQNSVPSSQPDDVEDSSGHRQSTKRKARAAQGNATVGTIQQVIERDFHLPTGSVFLYGPNGSPMRTNARIRTLRKRWEET